MKYYSIINKSHHNLATALHHLSDENHVEETESTDCPGSFEQKQTSI